MSSAIVLPESTLRLPLARFCRSRLRAATLVRQHSSKAPIVAGRRAERACCCLAASENSSSSNSGSEVSGSAQRQAAVGVQPQHQPHQQQQQQQLQQGDGSSSSWANGTAVEDGSGGISAKQQLAPILTQQQPAQPREPTAAAEPHGLQQPPGPGVPLQQQQQQPPKTVQQQDLQPQPPSTPGQPSTALPVAAQPAGTGVSNLVSRVVSGIVLGLGGACVVAVGGLPFLCAALFVVFHATQEFFGILTSKGISKGMPPPPPFVSAATAALCLSITAFTFFTAGKSGAALCVAAFCLLAMNVVVNTKPTFAQLTSSVFGLFYCGYLPSFWIKLRNLSISGPQLQLPGLTESAAAAIMGALPPLTVGLVATLTSVACIIAADTGAYFVGKNLGRTKLTDISPKKTVEGAVGGLASSVAAALLLWRLLGWPGSAAAAAGYAVLTFVSSLFGDLIESIMKRDAGIKDSGNLIPGHGGLLDRFDSYMFSGALAYFYITYLLPRFGLA